MARITKDELMEQLDELVLGGASLDKMREELNLSGDELMHRLAELNAYRGRQFTEQQMEEMGEFVHDKLEGGLEEMLKSSFGMAAMTTDAMFSVLEDEEEEEMVAKSEHQFEVVEFRIWRGPKGGISLNTTEKRPSGTTAEVFANVPKHSALYRQLADFLNRRQ